MRLSAHGSVAPRKRDYTSIFMKINACIKPAQNAHILACMLRFFAVPRLAMNPDPHFLDRFKPNLIRRKISGVVKWYLRILLAGSSMGSRIWGKKEACSVFCGFMLDWNVTATGLNKGWVYSTGRQILRLAGYFYGFIRQIFNNGLGFVYRLNFQIVFSNRDDIVGA